MPAPVPTSTLVRQRKNPFSYRLRLVTHARQHGLQAAACAFPTTRPPVRKGVRRFQAQARRDLEARSRAPRSCPHKSSGALAEGVRALRRPLPTFGTQRRKREWGLPRSHRALQPILRPHLLLRPRRCRYPKQPDRAALTAPWALFPQISADTPDLDDIPHSGLQMQALHRPAVQDTARQVGSGLPFLTFASRRSAQASALFAQRLQTHLQRCGVISATSPGRLTMAASSSANCSPTVPGLTSPPPSLPSARNMSASRPSAHSYQSDVETVHRLIADEFFDWESFSSRADLLAKASPYQLYFNLARPNSHKEGRAPWQIIQRLDPRLPLDLCLLRPVFLDYRLDSHGAYDVPRYP